MMRDIRHVCDVQEFLLQAVRADGARADHFCLSYECSGLMIPRVAYDSSSEACGVS